MLLTSLLRELGLEPETVNFGVDTAFYFLRGLHLPTSSDEIPAGRSDARLASDLAPQQGTAAPTEENRVQAGIPYNVGLGLEGLRRDVSSFIGHAMVAFLRDLSFPHLASTDPRAERLMLQKIASLDPSSPDWSAFTARDWSLYRRFGMWGDVPVHDIGFEVILVRYLDDEGHKLTRDLLGYETIVDNWNASVAIPWFANDFGRNTEYRMVRGGFTRLTTALANRLIAQGARIRPQHKLVSLTPLYHSQLCKDLSQYKPSSRHGLSSSCPDEWELCFEVGDQHRVKRIRVDKVVLAVPPGPLQKVEVRHKGWKHFAEDHLSAFNSLDLLKIFLVFDAAWWQRLSTRPLSAGRVYTTYPEKGIYFFDPDWMRSHALGQDSSQSERAMIMVYTDGRGLKYFTPVLGGGPANPRYSNPPRHWQELTDDDLVSIRRLECQLGPSNRMVDKIKEHLAIILDIPLARVPDPVLAICRHWSADPYAQAGWYTWKPGKRPWEVASRMADPFPGARLQVITEATSTEPGWVEGTFKSAELALHTSGLARPSWLAMSDEEFDDYIAL
jgi:hypothetical protein